VAGEIGTRFRRGGLDAAGLLEVAADEGAQVEAGPLPLAQVVGADPCRLAQRERIDEVLLVAEQPVFLHRLEQLGIGFVGGDRAFAAGVLPTPGRGRGRRRALAAGRQQEQDPGREHGAG
jgi:hypothetical protein